mmetsp:Transcript_27165/g.79124  ORF Transcript_27165/g.79124 Transcript_27165/m.79124 type:complete len:430 (+) Transcript_27165:3552-4841(+)
MPRRQGFLPTPPRSIDPGLPALAEARRADRARRGCASDPPRRRGFPRSALRDPSGLAPVEGRLPVRGPPGHGCCPPRPGNGALDPAGHGGPASGAAHRCLPHRGPPAVARRVPPAHGPEQRAAAAGSGSAPVRGAAAVAVLAEVEVSLGRPCRPGRALVVCPWLCCVLPPPPSAPDGSPRLGPGAGGLERAAGGSSVRAPLHVAALHPPAPLRAPPLELDRAAHDSGIGQHLVAPGAGCSPSHRSGAAASIRATEAGLQRSGPQCSSLHGRRLAPAAQPAHPLPGAAAEASRCSCSVEALGTDLQCIPRCGTDLAGRGPSVRSCGSAPELPDLGPAHRGCSGCRVPRTDAGRPRGWGQHRGGPVPPSHARRPRRRTGRQEPGGGRGAAPDSNAGPGAPGRRRVARGTTPCPGARRCPPRRAMPRLRGTG